MAFSLARTGAVATDSPAASPALDLALDGLGDIGTQQLADVLVDGGDEVGARAIDDRLQSGAELRRAARYR